MLKKQLATFTAFIAISLMYPLIAMGQSFPSSLNLAGLNNSNGFMLDTKINAQFSGSSIGDFNGDGIDDMALGFPFLGSAALPQQGTIAVIFGKSGTFESPLALSSLDGTNGFIINGVGDSLAGVKVSKIGDFNGDGLDDFLIGAPFADPGFVENGTINAGAVFVVFGKKSSFHPTLELTALDGANGFVINGERNSGLLGRAIDGAGDINDDGLKDIIIGDIGAFPETLGGAKGAGYVIFGKTTGFAASMVLSSLDGVSGFVVNSNDAKLLGGDVLGTGDLNGDGIDDLAVSSFDMSTNLQPVVFVIYGKTGPFSVNQNLSINGSNNGFAIAGMPGGQEGTISIGALGDINDDGINDLAIGARYQDPGGLADAGISYIIYGSSSRTPPRLAIDTLSASDGFSINGIAANDRAGAPTGGGDINGDGIDDIIIGALNAASNNNAEAGAVYVVYGKRSPFADSIELSSLDGNNGFTLLGAAANDQSGRFVSRLGDLNNDGIDDFLIGGTARFGSYVVFGRANAHTLVSSVLPSARSGFTGGSAITVFATVINGGTEPVQNCKIKISQDAPVSMNFQETDASNAAVGSADQAFNLDAGQARTFILSFSPKSVSVGTNVFPGFVCDHANTGLVHGVNTVFMSIGDVPVPDVLSIGATPSGNGILSVPQNGIGFMTASAVNIGAGDTPASKDSAITVSVDDGGTSLPLKLELCETDQLATCITPRSTADVSTTIGANASFFAIFATDQTNGAGIALDPANARVFLRFTDSSGTVRSVTSAAATVP